MPMPCGPLGQRLLRLFDDAGLVSWDPDTGIPYPNFLMIFFKIENSGQRVISKGRIKRLVYDADQSARCMAWEIVSIANAFGVDALTLLYNEPPKRRPLRPKSFQQELES